MSRAGRRIVRILRHEPELVGLTLAPGGWVEIDALVKGCRSNGMALNEAKLECIVSEDDKQRFTISEDGRHIRAAQGHSDSLNVDLGYDAVEPPSVLYHGTATKTLDFILKEGISSRHRRYVHLSFDLETAIKVGGRHGTPIVLEVQAEEMHGAGHPFYMAENGVWLTDHVPVNFFRVIS